MQINFFSLIIILSFIGPECPALTPDNNEVLINSQEKIEVRKIVFTSLFRESFKDLNKSPKVYCLSIESGKDPDEDFIQELSVKGVRVVGNSACSLNTAPDSASRGVIVDKNTGEPAIKFLISEIQWTGNNQIRVKARYDSSILSGSSFLYSLEKKSGKWKVTKTKRLNIS